MSRNVLFLHQSADLYGSDKVLLAIASRLSSRNFHPIVVVPVDGPLVEQLRHAGVECHIAPLTRLSRSLLSPRGLLAIPGELRSSFKALDHLLHGRTVAVLHSNTLAVLTGALWARRKKIPHIWHVHEIIVHPRFVKTTYGYLLKWFADRIICISKATQDNLVDSQPTLAGRCRLIWNGLTRDANTEPSAVSAYRTGLGLRNGEVLFAMVGRINRWKGQLLLVEAAGILWRRGVHNFRVVIVGSVVPRQEHFLDALNQAIAASPASAHITVQPFTSNVWVVWDSCDVAVTLPPSPNHSAWWHWKRWLPPSRSLQPSMVA
jgi:glycosyltransferase involved in cell wall biosynthesis